MSNSRVIDIEKKLFPESGKLIKVDDTYHALVIDEELDPISVAFHYDNCATLDTKDYSYIALSKDTLFLLIDLLQKAEKKYSQKK